MDSIYIRDVPSPTVYCRCTDATVHPKAPANAPKTDTIHYRDGKLFNARIGDGAFTRGRMITAHTAKELSDDDA